MAIRLVLASLATCGLIACAVGASDETPAPGSGEGGTVVGADGAALSPDGGAPGATGPTGSTGPGTFDSGPPATVGGGEDAGAATDEDAAAAADGCGGTALANNACTTLAQCPYACAANVAGVECTSGTCAITCNGETYDVNGVLSDGCEVVGKCVASQGTMVCPVDDHTQALAANAGSFPCDDSSSAQNMTGFVPSDDRAHVPAIDGFNATTGAAPDYFSITATGGALCQDDANLTLSMTLAPTGTTTQAACYVLTMVTDKSGTQTCNTDSSGSCSISNSSGSYSDNSTIYVWVSKNPSCAATTTDDGQFTITGHL